jgi:hypothetical protein
MTTASEVDALDPESDIIQLESGDRVVIQRLRTRQMFRLLKILTHGAGPALNNLNVGADTAEFITQLIAVTVMAIPNAEDETIDFVLSMVDSADTIDPPRTKADRARNEELRDNLAANLLNPSLDDLLSIIEIVIRKEAPEIAALGKRLGALLQTTLGNAPTAEPEPESLPEPEKRKPSSRSASKA